LHVVRERGQRLRCTTSSPVRALQGEVRLAKECKCYISDSLARQKERASVQAAHRLNLADEVLQVLAIALSNAKFWYALTVTYMAPT